ncbi:MAG: molybdopterin-dependent oxidoreductase [Deltaproteobacteria bacterium]|nr:molybdopterin-dependent oxidoreductase [Deltaproteobacteria bacterium]
MEKIALTINGKNLHCPQGTSILDVAEQNGIRIPKLCHHPDLKPFGACRLCIVEDEKSGRLMASCVTPVSPGMQIITDSPSVIEHRRNIIRLMLAEHPESCLVCSKGNRCQLRKIAAEMGLAQTDLYPMNNYKAFEQANPFITRDLSKCILCGKCIRADHELVVIGAIDYNLRGFKSRPSTVHDLGLENSSCSFCGTCISMCPTGALLPKNITHAGAPERETLSVCGFCGVGCSLQLGILDNQVVEINPSGNNDSVNKATLCVRGHFAHDFLNSAARLSQPMIRKEDELTPVSWDEALDHVAERLIDIKKRSGPMSIGFLGSSKCTNEENYLFQKIARVIIGTNNIDNGGYLTGNSIVSWLNRRTEGGWRVNPLSSLENAESIIVLGADPSHSLPVVSYYIKRAAVNGIPVIVIDPRKTDMARISSMWLSVMPDKDVELLNCLSALLWKKFAHDSNFMERCTDESKPYTDALSSFNPKRLCVESGVDMQSLEHAADLIAGKKIAFVVGQGIVQQRSGLRAIEALLNLSMLTGSMGHENGGIYVLAKENNQLGAVDMGTVSDSLPGGQLIKSDGERKQWEKNWDAKLSPDPGLNMIRMVEEAEKGNLKALFIMGENPLRSLPQPERVRKALSNLDFLVVQDILANETSEIADIVLPGAAFSEKSGSFTNLEGRIQSFMPAVSPPGDAKPDWEILDLLYSRMSSSEGYSSLEKIKEEIHHLVPMYSELGRNGNESWLTRTSSMSIFDSEGKGGQMSFSPMTCSENGKQHEGYGLKAILGSKRYHLGSGTRTFHSARIRDFKLKGEVEISPGDGAELGLKNGDTVRISSPDGSIEREVQVNNNLVSGIVFVPVAFHNNDAMQLIPLTRVAKTGLKECHVTIEKQGSVISDQ